MNFYSISIEAITIGSIITIGYLLMFLIKPINNEEEYFQNLKFNDNVTNMSILLGLISFLAIIWLIYKNKSFNQEVLFVSFMWCSLYSMQYLQHVKGNKLTDKYKNSSRLSKS